MPSILTRLTSTKPADVVIAPISTSYGADLYTTGTNDDVVIQYALDSLPASGGKVLLLSGTYNIGDTILMDSYQRLEGSGKSTILKAKASLNKDIIYSQTTTFNRYVEIVNMTIDGNRANNTDGRGIRLHAPRNCTIDHVWIKETDSDAIRFSGVSGTLGWYNWIQNSEIDNCDNGINITGYCEHNYIIANTITFVAGNGVFCDSDQDIIALNKFDQCTGRAVQLEFGAGAFLVYKNTFDNGSDHDIVVRSAPKTVIEGNWFGGGNQTNKAHVANGQFGSDASNYVSVIGNHMTESGATYGVREVGGATVGCVYKNNTITGPTNTVTLDAATQVVEVGDNMGGSNIEERKIFKMKNTSGGALAVGDVVVMKAAAGGNEVTTTTTQGDPKVFGMAIEAISDNAFGYVQVLGKTVSLKVNGTTDIAIGDLLGTFTTAKIAMKASAGDTAFAMALEGYTTNDSSGVIDAVLIPPREA